MDCRAEGIKPRNVVGGRMAAIEPLDAEDLAREIEPLSRLLVACVEAGASIGFVLPFGMDEARAFWREAIRPALARGNKLMLIARNDAGQIIGTGQLNPGTLPNQRHRAEVSKLMVDPAARRQGIARAIMAALEARAVALGLRLLTLDTRSDDAAEPLYLSLGYKAAGRIPGYAQNAIDPTVFDSTTYMYKEL